MIQPFCARPVSRPALQLGQYPLDQLACHHALPVEPSYLFACLAPSYLCTLVINVAFLSALLMNVKDVQLRFYTTNKQKLLHTWAKYTAGGQGTVGQEGGRELDVRRAAEQRLLGG